MTAPETAACLARGRSLGAGPGRSCALLAGRWAICHSGGWAAEPRSRMLMSAGCAGPRRAQTAGTTLARARAQRGASLPCPPGHRRHRALLVCGHGKGGPRECHAERSKSDRKRQEAYDCTHLWERTLKATDGQTRETNRNSDSENSVVVPRGDGVGGHKG